MCHELWRGRAFARSAVLTIALAMFWGCSDSAAVLGSMPRSMEVATTLPLRVELGEERLAEYACLFNADGTIWAFGMCSTRMDTATRTWSLKLACFHGRGGNWTQVGDLFSATISPQWRYPLAATLGASGRPVIAWIEYERNSSFAGPVSGAAWNGQDWERFRSTIENGRGVGDSSVVLATDRNGVTHCVYLGGLEPAEAYMTGLDGWFPLKPFHITEQKLRWSVAAPMEEHSRWAYSDMALVAGKRELHFVSVVEYANRLTREGKKIEYRAFSDGQWSSPERLSVSEAGITSPSISEDDAGNLHLVYSVFLPGARLVPHPARYRMRRNGVWLAPAPIGDMGHNAVVASDIHGNVYCYWQEGGYFDRQQQTRVPAKGYLQVWNSRATSKTIQVPAGDCVRLYPNPAGGCYLTWRDGKSVAISGVVATDSHP